MSLATLGVVHVPGPQVEAMIALMLAPCAQVRYPIPVPTATVAVLDYSPDCRPRRTRARWVRQQEGQPLS